ncbi:hypothetical protein BOTNAR_0003g00770 [Botryotinia narcissicola]|uniref:Uncharacterized protein n=1 Tax=Botryotinia narcissicola TaxID=278944 RepID=A0A4Z1JLM9_9HELO|nr:hypothetical protein BOTNAR_0003g00770 [Botryotinia narcissicola]
MSEVVARHRVCENASLRSRGWMDDGLELCTYAKRKPPHSAKNNSNIHTHAINKATQHSRESQRPSHAKVSMPALHERGYRCGRQAAKRAWLVSHVKAYITFRLGGVWMTLYGSPFAAPGMLCSGVMRRYKSTWDPESE